MLADITPTRAVSMPPLFERSNCDIPPNFTVIHTLSFLYYYIVNTFFHLIHGLFFGISHQASFFLDAHQGKNLHMELSLLYQNLPPFERSWLFSKVVFVSVLPGASRQAAHSRTRLSKNPAELRVIYKSCSRPCGVAR